MFIHTRLKQIRNEVIKEKERVALIKDKIQEANFNCLITSRAKRMLL